MTSKNEPILNANKDAKAAIDAMSRLLAMEAIPAPVKFTNPNAKTSRSQTKFNLVTSRGWLNQVLRNVNSSLKSINQRNPKMIKPGNISDCILADKFGIKKAKGAKITFMVIDREAMGTKMPIAFVGGPLINS